MSTAKDMTGLPKQIDSILEVNETSRGLYQLGDSGYKELTPGGRFLRRVKQVVLEHQCVEFAPPQVWGKAPTEIALPDWSSTMAAANKDERRSLLQLAAAGHVTIKR